MKVEYCPSFMNNMTSNEPECDTNLKICGYDGRRDESEMKFTGCQYSYSPSQKGIAGTTLKKNQEEELILISDEKFNPEIYADLKILPEDELSMMKVYCSSAGKDGYDVSVILSYINIAVKNYEEGNIDDFYETIELFYSLYDELCMGSGGRLYASGDYLLFLYESVKVRFSNPYI